MQVLHSSSKNQVCLTVTQDGNQPVVSFGRSSFKFYLYQDSNLTWGMVNPSDDPSVSSDGTYTLDIPSGINPQSFIIQVQDQRGIMVCSVLLQPLHWNPDFQQHIGKRRKLREPVRHTC